MMKYQYCPGGFQGYYATDLKVDRTSNRMTWTISQGTDTLIVQSPYGQDAGTVIPKLCEGLNQINMRTGIYAKCMNDVWVRYVSTEEKLSNGGGCAINQEASRYTVLACHKEGDICKIYEPYERGMNIAHYDIPLEIRINIQKQLCKKGKESIEFYSLTFPEKLKNTFIEDSLCYEIDGQQIPVTREMVKQGTVYIETMMEPNIISLNEGIWLI